MRLMHDGTAAHARTLRCVCLINVFTMNRRSLIITLIISCIGCGIAVTLVVYRATSGILRGVFVGWGVG